MTICTPWGKECNNAADICLLNATAQIINPVSSVGIARLCVYRFCVTQLLCGPRQPLSLCHRRRGYIQDGDINASDTVGGWVVRGMQNEFHKIATATVWRQYTSSSPPTLFSVRIAPLSFTIYLINFTLFPSRSLSLLFRRSPLSFSQKE